MQPFKVILIASAQETTRKVNIELLQQQFPKLYTIDACFPTVTHVPFLNAIRAASKQRTGTALSVGEIGCLLSHRKAWQYITNHAIENEHVLIVESDSRVNECINLWFDALTQNCDIFFWGAWEGHSQLFRSSVSRLPNGFKVGEPFIKSVYCTYGYSLNRKAASLLLKRTKRSSYPVDQFKRFMRQQDLKLGAIKPEVIFTNRSDSSIRVADKHPLLRSVWLLVLDIKNNLICYFK